MKLVKESLNKMNLGVNADSRQMKLATKISIATGAMLTIILVVLVILSSLNVKSVVKEGANGEFSGIADQNGLIVQAVLDDASTIAKNLQDYIERQYELYEDGNLYTGGVKKALYME